MTAISQDALLSPRLAALRAELWAGNTAALDGFWREVADRETPLIEPAGDGAEQELVTFLWRGGAEIEDVVVVGGLAGLDFAGNRMERLLETDVWHRTYRARADARTTYWLSPNDPLTPPDEVRDWQERTATWQPDPLNPRAYVALQYTEEGNDREKPVSVIELSQAPPQPWVGPRPSVHTGSLELHRLQSDILGNERRVWVYTPPGYAPDAGPYGLLVVFDGYAYTHVIPTPTILDNLLSEDRIPPMIAVMPDSVSRSARDRELPCYPPFVDFLTEELLGWARRRYHVTSDPAQTVVAGSSYGGLAAAFAGFRRPDVFGNVLSQSGSFWWKPSDDTEHEWLPRQLATSKRLPLRFYLDVGLMESVITPSGGPSQVLSNRHMRDVLQAREYPLHYAEFNGGHDSICWQGTLSDGLLALVGTDGPDAPV